MVINNLKKFFPLILVENVMCQFVPWITLLPVSYPEDSREATEDLFMIPNCKYSPDFCSALLRTVTKSSIRHL